MFLIDLILPKTAVPRKRPQSYLFTSFYQGTIFRHGGPSLWRAVTADTADLHAREIVPGIRLRWWLNATGVVKFSDFGPVEGYISETVQDTASGTIND